MTREGTGVVEECGLRRTTFSLCDGAGSVGKRGSRNEWGRGSRTTGIQWKERRRESRERGIPEVNGSRPPLLCELPVFSRLGVSGWLPS